MFHVRVRVVLSVDRLRVVFSVDRLRVVFSVDRLRVVFSVDRLRVVFSVDRLRVVFSVDRLRVVFSVDRLRVVFSVDRLRVGVSRRERVKGCWETAFVHVEDMKMRFEPGPCLQPVRLGYISHSQSISYEITLRTLLKESL